MICKTCRHYQFYLMITQGSYHYAGDIPCLRCKHFSVTEDNYEPIPPNQATPPDPQKPSAFSGR